MSVLGDVGLWMPRGAYVAAEEFGEGRLDIDPYALLGTRLPDTQLTRPR